ncbi:MAG: ATP synthase F1 subunit gamma [Spirochaetes bacterium GWF1_41_5]|nr:MAG: ATP synthase F1 subunit gamma [Spirochaetes bacterium GWF1_41_5]HBE02123.1 ATP synthase F1 subunit gamma [Spirochaetia bacterium]
MANSRELRQKVSSLRGMQKVMRAMNMIATIKLRKLSSLQAPLAFFENTVNSILNSMPGTLSSANHPLFHGNPQARKTHIVIFTADKGLCGSHNSSVHRALDGYIAAQGNAKEIEITCIGGKGKNFCRRKGYNVFFHMDAGSSGTKQLQGLSSLIGERFLKGEIEHAALIYNKYISVIHQQTLTVRLLPLVSGRKDTDAAVAYTEPEFTFFADAAAKLALYYRLQIALYNSRLSEQASRMTAMENATTNADDLISRYSALLNRARQSVITNEIIEVVSGKEAMKGKG